MQVSILNIPVIATALIDSALPDLHTYPRQRFICEYFAQLSQVFTPATRPKFMHFKWCANRKKEMENPKICAQNGRSHCCCCSSCSCCCWWSDIIQNSINSMHGSYVERGRCGRRVQLPNKRTTSHTEMPHCHPMSGARHTVHKTWMRHGQKLPHKCELIVQQHATRRAAAKCSAAAVRQQHSGQKLKNIFN